MKTYKVWIEIEEYDEETDEYRDVETLDPLPFAASANCTTLEDAVDVAKQMHLAVNEDFIYP